MNPGAAGDIPAGKQNPLQVDNKKETSVNGQKSMPKDASQISDENALENTKVLRSTRINSINKPSRRPGKL